MSLLHYLDFEPPLADEGWTVVEVGASTALRLAAAAFPERGSNGLRVTIDSTSPAYVTRSLSDVIDAGTWFAFGFWLNARTMPGTNYSLILGGKAATSWWEIAVALNSNGTLRAYCQDDASATKWTDLTVAIGTDEWHYVVWMAKRATSDVAADGVLAIYLDGQLADDTTGIDNYDTYPSLTDIRVGIWGNPKDGTVLDHDEVKFATGATVAAAYPEPYSPTAASTELSEAARTLVFYRQGSADSLEFADYLVTQLSIPRSHRVPLPNATSTESLASYATFESEVEDDLNAWLAVNPVIAAKVSTFIIGYGVPGYFSSGGIIHSAASRLMRDRKSTRLNSSHIPLSRMPSSA